LLGHLFGGEDGGTVAKDDDFILGFVEFPASEDEKMWSDGGGSVSVSI
jgi:hypothetical protein